MGFTFELELAFGFGFGGRCSLGASGAAVGELGGVRFFWGSTGAECRCAIRGAGVGEGVVLKERGLGMGCGLF